MLKDLIVVLILVVIIGLAIGYIVKSKKSGAKCIGCPSGGCCSSKSSTGCDCGCQGENK